MTTTRAILLGLLVALVVVGLWISGRLRSEAILFHLVPHCGVFHPDRPEYSDPDGRFRLDPNDDSLPTGPEPLNQESVALWLTDQWPGITLSKPRVYVSGTKGRVQYRRVEFDVDLRGRRSPAGLLCVRNEGDTLFRGWVVIHDRVGESYTMDSDIGSSLSRPKISTRLMQSVGWEWTVTYPEPKS